MRDETMILTPQVVAVLGSGALQDLPAAEYADMIELRLDLVEEEPLETLRALRRATTRPIIATCRPTYEGGRFEGEEVERLELLAEASEYASLVDIELRAQGRLRVSRPLIVSYHDFSGTPSREKMEGIIRDMMDAGAAIAKLAVTPSSLKDNLLILEMLLGAEAPLCMIAMGPLGRHMRAIAPLYGSLLTYGYVSQPAAPGQMRVDELVEAMRLLSIR
ncbi:MAG: type I 3-dehydroquinate dehydratase [Methanothrix sp.]|nr:type I 3-dehydroquinate dehydratase [Methanothrix sp.]